MSGEEGAIPLVARPFEDADPVRQYATLTFIRGGLVAIGVTVVGGLLAALYSVPSLAPAFQSLGLDLRQLRPIHTTFASAWIFLGGDGRRSPLLDGPWG